MQSIVRVLMLAALAGSASADPARSGVSMVDPGAPLEAGRLCYGDGRDIACDESAPLVDNIGAPMDRIVSGTSSVVVQKGGAISITSGGAAVGHFDIDGLKVAGTVSAVTVHVGQSRADCEADGDVGMIRRNPVTGRLQICAAY